MPEHATQEELVRSMSLSSRLLLALCRKDVRPAIYSDTGHSSNPDAYDDPLQQLYAAYPDFTQYLKGKSVLDFGCAEGDQSRALIKAGARCVHGLDINASAIKVATEKSRGIPNLTFSDSMPSDAKFDVILSQNSFEHFIDAAGILKLMSEVLAPGGRIFVTFGPTWYSPWGAHVEFFCRVPWVHLIFPEKTIVIVRRVFRSDDASNYTEMGLARMSLRKFRQLVTASNFAIEYSRLDCIKGLNFLRLTPLRELFISQISCILTRAS